MKTMPDSYRNNSTNMLGIQMYYSLQPILLVAKMDVSLVSKKMDVSRH
jgi:hypothetical protein